MKTTSDTIPAKTREKTTNINNGERESRIAPLVCQIIDIRYHCAMEIKAQQPGMKISKLCKGTKGK